MNKRACLLITADMYTPVLLLTSCQQDGLAEKARKNVDQTFEEAGKINRKNRRCDKRLSRNGASSLDDASITMDIINENSQLQL